MTQVIVQVISVVVVMVSVVYIGFIISLIVIKYRLHKREKLLAAEPKSSCESSR